METVYNLIKSFDFVERERANLTFSDPDKIRLNSQESCIQLKDQDGNNEFYGLAPNYSTDDDLYVKTPLWSPDSLINWAGFDYIDDITYGASDALVSSSVRFRLSVNGTDQLWWNGASWDTPAPGEWNTVQEVHDNISTFPKADKKLQVIVNLKTTNSTETPKVLAIRILYSSSINFEYDLIYNSLVPYIESVRPIKDWGFNLITDTDAMNFSTDNDYPVDPFNIQDVIAIYNHDDDPDHSVNLLSDYNSSTKIATLTSSQSAGKLVWVRFTYKPRCDTMVHQDYKEVEKIPAIILEDINEINGVRLPGYTFVRDRAAKTAKLINAPYKMTLRVTARLVTDKNRDMAALHQSILALFSQSPLLTSKGLDEEYSIMPYREFNNVMTPNLSDLKNRIIIFDILDINFWIEGDQDSGIVTTGLKSSGDVTFTSG